MWDGSRGTDTPIHALHFVIRLVVLEKRGAPFLASFARIGDFDLEKLQTTRRGKLIIRSYFAQPRPSANFPATITFCTVHSARSIAATFPLVLHDT
jgi:hypothetical protein